MEVKKRNMTELVLHGALLVLLFLPGMYKREEWESSPDSLGMRNTWSDIISFWNKGTDCLVGKVEMWVLATALCALIIIVCVAIALSIIQLLGEGEKSNRRVLLPFPFVELVLFIVPAFFRYTPTEYNYHTGYSWHYHYAPYVLFPIGIVLLAALILITLIGYTRASKRGVVEVSDRGNRAYSGKRAAPAATRVSDIPDRGNRGDSGKRSVPPAAGASADELRKYKELLDDGVITQEEFDRIKRQMLGL